MQSGKIKHWNQDKGYGFIDVDNQSEDVFFHVSKVRLSQPITIGQRVYFNSERNDKNQLRATEVTSNELSISNELNTLATADANITNHRANTGGQNDAIGHHKNQRHNSRNRRHDQNHQRSGQPKKSALSTLFSLIALIAVAVYFFGDLSSEFLTENTDSTTVSQTSSEAQPPDTGGVTGDAQIDHTVALIQQGGPFPYPQKDGTTFYNREGRLPAQSQGYYREYTVPTPGVSHRGARRIVTGGHPPTVYYLTVDHYDSFRRLDVK